MKVITKQELKIGNNTWIRNKCDECEKDHQVIVELGEEQDFGSDTAHICLNCLKKAIKLVEGIK